MEIESIRIEKAENGFSVDCHYRAKDKKGKKGEPEALEYMAPVQHVFQKAADVVKFVGDKLGGKLNEASSSEYRSRRDAGEGMDD